jgi:serine/threonine protein kinase
MIAQNTTDFSGQQFGNYELESLLKSRAASDLYLARDVKLDQPAYVEVLRVPVSENPELAGRFQRRMETVSQIKNDNIAPVIETGVSDGGYAYSVIEYIQGVWMSDMLADWRENEFILPVGDALLLGREIADALSAGHSAGLIHHDLRPDNILISDVDNQPMVIDLGVPVTTNMRNGVLSESRSNMLDYASPEELKGKSIGRRSNIYSLGIMLYELLTGHRPELPTSSWDVFEHSSLPKEVPLEEAREGLSGETYRLVRNCLWRQEWSRFETADEVISAIDTAMLAEQTVTKTAIWSDGRNRWLYVAVPVLALLAIVIGLVLLWSQFANAEPQDSEATAPAVVVDADATAEKAEGATEAIDSLATEPLPTVTPTVTQTREAPPTSAMDTTIPVFGPLTDQVFKIDETIGFAWIWFSQPEQDEAFTVYIEAEDHENDPIAIGAIDEPDNASLYRLDTNAVELELTPGSYLWQVRLENVNNESTAVESDKRRFFIAEEPTATPVFTSTATPQATLEESSVTPESATATTAASQATSIVCVPQRPYGWVSHRIQAGEFISLFAARANVSTEVLLEANCLSRSSVLSIGQLIYIPEQPATATSTPRPTLTPLPSSGGGGSSNSNQPAPTKTKKPIPVPGE